MSNNEVNFGVQNSKFIIRYFTIIYFLEKPLYTSKAPDGQGPLLTNYKPKL